MEGAASLKENIDLIEKYNASVMITKESGEIGGVIEKIQAANQKDISLIIIPYKSNNINTLNTDFF